MRPATVGSILVIKTVRIRFLRSLNGARSTTEAAVSAEDSETNARPRPRRFGWAPSQDGIYHDEILHHRRGSGIRPEISAARTAIAAVAAPRRARPGVANSLGRNGITHFGRNRTLAISPRVIA